jgi:hypothetical protein
VGIYFNGTKPVLLTCIKARAMQCVSKIGKVRDMASATCLVAYRQNNEIQTRARPQFVRICVIPNAPQSIRPPNEILVTTEPNSQLIPSPKYIVTFNTHYTFHIVPVRNCASLSIQTRHSTSFIAQRPTCQPSFRL